MAPQFLIRKFVSVWPIALPAMRDMAMRVERGMIVCHSGDSGSLIMQDVGA